MIHLVMFKIREGAAREDVDRLVTEARAKLTQIPGVSNLRAGWVMQRDCPHRVVLSMELPSEEALAAYRTHPIHVDYVENVIKPVESERLVIDFSEEPL